jgi:hypothetical protein
MKASLLDVTSFMKAQGKENCNFYQKKYHSLFLDINFFKYLVFKTLDPEPDPHP